MDAGEQVSLQGKIQGDASAAYAVKAEAGQELKVSLHAPKGAPLFNVYAPGTGPGQDALFRGSVEGNTANLKLSQSGEYRIEVYQMRSAARRGTVVNFTLTIALRR